VGGRRTIEKEVGRGEENGSGATLERWGLVSKVNWKSNVERCCSGCCGCCCGEVGNRENNMRRALISRLFKIHLRVKPNFLGILFVSELNVVENFKGINKKRRRKKIHHHQRTPIYPSSFLIVALLSGNINLCCYHSMEPIPCHHSIHFHPLPFSSFSSLLKRTFLE